MLIPVVLAAALMNAAMITASAVSTILITVRLSPALAGLPNTAGVLGTAAGALASAAGPLGGDALRPSASGTASVLPAERWQC